MQILEALVEVMDVLEGAGRRAALLGGLAVSVWTDPRFTRDVDLAVVVESDAEAEAVVRLLGGSGYRLMATVEQTATDRLATARMLPAGEDEDGLVVDLLFASSGIEAEIVADAVLIEIGASVPVRVARPGHLVALKLLAHDATTRPQDGVDLRALRANLHEEERARAREACRLIEQRGYARGRDLVASLDALLGER